MATASDEVLPNRAIFCRCWDTPKLSQDRLIQRVRDGISASTPPPGVTPPGPINTPQVNIDPPHHHNDVIGNQ